MFVEKEFIVFRKHCFVHATEGKCPDKKGMEINYPGKKHPGPVYDTTYVVC